MAKAPATISGYPMASQAARVIQAPATTQPRMQGTTMQAGSLVQPRTVGTMSPTLVTSAAQPRVMTSQPRVVTAGSPTSISGGLVSGGVRQAAQPRVVTAGSPTTVSGGLVSGGVRQAAQPRVVTAGSPTTLSGGVAFGGSSQAKVISSGSISGTVQPTYMTAGANRIVPGTTFASSPGPRVVQAARPATVVQQGNNIYDQSLQTQSAYEAKHQDDPQLQNLKEVRKACGLKAVPVNDCLQVLKGASVDGKLSRDQFMVAYVQLLQQNNVEAPDDKVKNAVFDLFDRDDNGVVDMMELICGASLMCTGTEEDKIHAVFNVFDENGDGVISMDEMFKFLTSVFKVVLTPNVMAVMNTMGVTVESAEDLASVTALECFKTADLNHDGRLSVSEFKNWFFAPRNDPSFLFSPVRKLLQ